MTPRIPLPTIPAEDFAALNNRELGEKYGISEYYVVLLRDRAGVASPGKPREMSDADLTRPTRDLMAEFGVSKSAVNAAKRRAGLGYVRPAVPTAELTTLSYEEVKRRYGISGNLVARLRREAGMPIGTRRNYAGKLDGADLTRPTGELIAEYGVTSGAVYNARKRLGLPTRTGTRSTPRSIAKPRTVAAPPKRTAPQADAVPAVPLPEINLLDPPTDDAQIPAWVTAARKRGAKPAAVALALGMTVAELGPMWRAA